MSLRKAAKLYGVPRNTLYSNMRSDNCKMAPIGGKRILDDEEEASLAAYMRYFAGHFSACVL